MERVERNERIVVRYHVNDRVMVMTEDGQKPGTVVYIDKWVPSDNALGYGVRVDGERYTRRVSHHAIVIQAHEAVIGRTEYVEKF